MILQLTRTLFLSPARTARDIKPYEFRRRARPRSTATWPLLLATLLVCSLLPPGGPLRAETARTPSGVGVDEKLGDYLPLDRVFTDEQGREIPLRSFFQDDRRPVLLVPGYYNCPRLCSLVFNGVRDGVAAVLDQNLKPGRDFTVVSLSFDPEETPALARAKAKNYRASIPDQTIPEAGWVFLTGRPAAIDAVLDAIGYRYRKDGEEYSHAAALVAVAPDGKISRYLYGIKHRPYDFRLALVEASDGRIGQTFDKVLLYCFRYDPQSGKYTPYAWAFLRIGGALVFFTLVGLIIFLRFYGKNPGNNA